MMDVREVEERHSRNGQLRTPMGWMAIERGIRAFDYDQHKRQLGLDPMKRRMGYMH